MVNNLLLSGNLFFAFEVLLHRGFLKTNKEMTIALLKPQFVCNKLSSTGENNMRAPIFLLALNLSSTSQNSIKSVVYGDSQKSFQATL